MKKNKNNIEFKLFPNGAKKVGWSFFALAIILLFILGITDYFNIQENKGYFGDIFWGSIILGMMIIAFSKEKIEDERVRSHRYKSMASAFLFATLFTVFSPFIDFLFQTEFKTLSAHYVICVAFGMYLVQFSLIRNEKMEDEA